MKCNKFTIILSLLLVKSLPRNISVVKILSVMFNTGMLHLTLNLMLLTLTASYEASRNEDFTVCGNALSVIAQLLVHCFMQLLHSWCKINVIWTSVIVYVCVCVCVLKG